MQNNTLRRTTAALGALVTATTAFALASPAEAADRPASRITVRASDTTPESGEQFVLRGRLITESGRALSGGLVRVQALRAGDWTNLTGARVTTDSEGRYRVRVILSQRGERDLRVVGNPAGDRLRNAHKRLDVFVG